MLCTMDQSTVLSAYLHYYQPSATAATMPMCTDYLMCNTDSLLTDHLGRCLFNSVLSCDLVSLSSAQIIWSSVISTGVVGRRKLMA